MRDIPGFIFRYIPHFLIYRQKIYLLLYEKLSLTPVSSESGRRSKRYQIQDSEVSGKTNQKVDPSPCCDRTPILPPNFSTTVCESVNPNPVPGTSRSSLVKQLNILLCSSEDIPIPESRT